MIRRLIVKNMNGLPSAKRRLRRRRKPR